MVVRSSLIYLIAKILPGVFGIVTTALLTRVLSPTEYGLYGVAMIIMVMASNVGFDWLGLSLQRLYEARQSDPRTLPTFTAMFFAIVVASACLFLLALALGIIPPDDRRLCAIGLAMAWCYALFELLARVESARFRPMAYLAVNLTRAVLLLTLTLGAAALSHDALATAMGTTVALGLAAIPIARRYLRFSRRLFDPVLCREVVRFGLPFVASMLLASLVTAGVRSLVGLLNGARDLGLYTAAFALSQNTLTVIAAALGAATYPLAVRAVERGDPAALRAQLEENCTIVLAVMMPACLGLALTAHELAAQVVGPEFRVAVARLVPLMSIAVLFASFRAFYLDHAFQLGNRSGLQVTISAVAAVLALSGTAILVPRVGLIGAPLATLAAMAISCVHAGIAGRRALPMPLPVGPGLRVACCTAAMVGAVALVPSGLPFSLYAKVGAGGAVYAAACFALDLLGLRSSAVALLARARARRSATEPPAGGAGADAFPMSKDTDRQVPAALHDRPVRSMGR